jgi:hypothetical protein
MVSSAAAQLLQQPYVNLLKLSDSAKSGDVRDTMVRYVMQPYCFGHSL